MGIRRIDYYNISNLSGREFIQFTEEFENIFYEDLGNEDKLYVSELFHQLSQLWYFQDFFLQWITKNTYYREEVVQYLLKYGEPIHLLSLATTLRLLGGNELLLKYHDAIVSQLKYLEDAHFAVKWAIHFKDYDSMRDIVIRNGSISDYCQWFRYIKDDDGCNELKIRVIQLGLVEEVIRSMKSKVPSFSSEHFYSTLPREYQLGVIL